MLTRVESYATFHSQCRAGNTRECSCTGFGGGFIKMAAVDFVTKGRNNSHSSSSSSNTRGQKQVDQTWTSLLVLAGVAVLYLGLLFVFAPAILRE